MDLIPYKVQHWKTQREGWVVWQHGSCTHSVIWFRDLDRYEWRRAAAFVTVWPVERDLD